VPVEDLEDEDLDTDFEEWKRRERDRRRKAKEDRRRSLDRDEALAKLRYDAPTTPVSTPSPTTRRVRKDKGGGEKGEKGSDDQHTQENFEEVGDSADDQLDDEDGRRIVKLNIGGRKYVTTVKSLRGQMGEKNYFTALFGDQFAPPETDAKGYYFIDRNGSLFEPILDYLRTGIDQPSQRSLTPKLTISIQASGSVRMICRNGCI